MATDNNNNDKKKKKKYQKITSVGGDSQKLESLYTIDRISKMVQLLLKTVWQVLKNSNRIAMWSRYTSAF